MMKKPMTELEKTIKGLDVLINYWDDDGRWHEHIWDTNIYDTLIKARNLLDDPDRVKIVRCEDCRFWIPNNAEEGDDSGECHNGQCEGETTFSYFFCADGEADE